MIMRTAYLTRSDIHRLSEDHNIDPDGDEHCIRGEHNILAFVADLLDKYEENRAKAEQSVVPSPTFADQLEQAVKIAIGALSAIASREFCGCGCPTASSARILPAFHSYLVARTAKEDIDYLLHNTIYQRVVPEGLMSDDPSVVLKVAKVFAHQVDSSKSDTRYTFLASQILELMRALSVRAKLEHVDPSKVAPPAKPVVDFTKLRPDSIVTFVTEGPTAIRRRGDFSHVVFTSSGVMSSIVVTTWEFGVEIPNYVGPEAIIAIEHKYPSSPRIDTDQ
jgi:hypothetical protein